MSQIDKVVYLPNLFWFWIFFICLYIFLFSTLITYIYTAFKFRVLYIEEISQFCLTMFYFNSNFIIFCLDLITKNYYKKIFLYLINAWCYDVLINLKLKQA